jgi:hypothetical protein
MTSQDNHMQDDTTKAQEAVAILEEVLATVATQRRDELDQWECFHFTRGMYALCSNPRNYEGVHIEAAYAFDPLKWTKFNCRGQGTV